MATVKIENLNRGSAMEQINEAIKCVAADLSNRPDVVGKREIISKIRFVQKDDFVSVEYDVEVKVPKDNAKKTAIWLDSNSNLVDRMETPTMKGETLELVDRKSAAAGGI